MRPDIKPPIERIEHLPGKVKDRIAHLLGNLGPGKPLSDLQDRASLALHGLPVTHAVEKTLEEILSLSRESGVPTLELLNSMAELVNAEEWLPRDTAIVISADSGSYVVIRNIKEEPDG